MKVQRNLLLTLRGAVLTIVALGFLMTGMTTHQAKAASTASTVTLSVSGMNATISNGLYTIKLNSAGRATSLVFNGKELIGGAAGFYSSINGGTSFSPNQLQVTTNTATMADIAYISSWGALHYVVRSGVSGLYSYFVATSIGTVGEFRTLYRLDGNIFRSGNNGIRTIAFPTLSQIKSAKVLQDSTYQLADGTIYTKYDATTYVSQDNMHGVLGSGVGVWVISPSHEYVNGGPMKQELTVHVESNTGDAVLLNMISATHFGNPNISIPSGKIFGPWLVYFNDGSISGAQAQAATEKAAWPYSWLSNASYPLARTTVTGTLRLANGQPAAGATVTLAKPGGDLYAQGSDYMFSTQADSSGNFSISKVRPGTYSLYAFANGGSTSPGSIGTVTDQFERDNISVSGPLTNVGLVTWSPTVHANFLWQIGTSDRKADEFRLGNVPRQYGLFNQVPANLTYTIGSSSPATNWYYAQTQVGTWTMNFNLAKTFSGNGHLTVAVAGESRAVAVNIGVNGSSIGSLPNFTNDAGIYRSANQSGAYHLVTINFAASLLKAGANSLTFHATNVSAGGGIMYDTIKLESD